MSIIPAYWIKAIVSTIYYCILFSGKSDDLLHFIKESIFLLPVETLGLQSAFCSLFNYSHNSGTWFVSCLLFCYFTFPLIKNIAEELSESAKIYGIIILSTLLLYSAFVPHVCHTADIYSNIVFRTMEFFIGVLLARCKISEKTKALLCNWYVFVIESIILLAGISIAYKIGIPQDYMLYSWIALPCFVAMIITLSGINNNRIMESQVVSYACKISYMFFLVQFYAWQLTKIILSSLGLLEINVMRILLSFVLCVIITIVFYECGEKPLKKIFKRVLIKN